MPTMAITNPEIDQEVAGLVTEAYEMITSNWRAVIPALRVTIATEPFNRIPQLRAYCKECKMSDGEKPKWKYIQVACIDFSEKEAVLWVYFNRQSIMHSPDYYFKKEFFALIAKLLWYTSERIRNEVKRHATGMAAQYEGAAYMAFRDTFSRFFLNPGYLREQKEDAWYFMSGVDRALSQAQSLPA